MLRSAKPGTYSSYAFSSKLPLLCIHFSVSSMGLSAPKGCLWVAMDARKKERGQRARQLGAEGVREKEHFARGNATKPQQKRRRVQDTLCHTGCQLRGTHLWRGAAFGCASNKWLRSKMRSFRELGTKENSSCACAVSRWSPPTTSTRASPCGRLASPKTAPLKTISPPNAISQWLYAFADVGPCNSRYANVF